MMMSSSSNSMRTTTTTTRTSSQASTAARRPPSLARGNRRCPAVAAAAAAGDAASAATTTTTTSTPSKTITRATLRTTDACELAVSIYPFFRYKAAGGGGDATVEPAAAAAAATGTDPASTTATTPTTINLTFDPTALRIPALDYRTAYLFGVVPIPPPLRIAIEPLQLSGTLDRATGEARLTFDAQFCFTAGALYRAPPLRVQTVLTTGESVGARLSGTGRPWAGAGVGSNGSSNSSASPTSIRLAGVARVPKTGDALLDAFLMLPNDALAVLEGELELL
jgi:hypothetical protein